MKKNLSVITLLCVLLSCRNQTEIKGNSYLDKEALPVIQHFFAGIKRGNDSAVYDLIRQNSYIGIKDSLTQDMISKFNLVNNASGAFMGDTLLKKRLLNDDIGVYSYLAKYEKKFYRFIFVFYNNGKNVKLYRFSFDQTIDDEFEEGLKYYYGS